MKKKIISAIPEIFSLRGNDYSSFVVKGGAGETMRKNWDNLGHRLSDAAAKVEKNVKKKQAA